ncbi:MAG: DUF4139 domain-containing protein [Planctomycetota bacterium]|jgi:hypothetical protein
MKRHLTERQLIEYRFKLACEPAMKSIAGHLQDCAGCREALEGLNRRFAALDLLREEVEVSEDLISQAVENAGRPAQKKVFSFKVPVWIGAAAAVILMGSLVLVSELERGRGPGGEFAVDLIRSGKPVSTADSYKEHAEKTTSTFDAKRKMAKGHDLEMDVTDISPQAAWAGTEDRNQKTYGAAPLPHRMERLDKANITGEVSATTMAPAEGEIPEQPPFAPASAIELVTLPRRDKVQVTIYNSADLTLVRESRKLTLKKGWNWLQFMWANTLIDPTSLHLEPLAHKGKIDIQQLVFPSRLRELGRWLIRSDVGGQVPFEITYFTSGLSWRAFYMGTLSTDEQKMKLQGYVRVGNNSGEDYENAQTRLIVGQVHILDQIAELARRQYPYDRPGGPFVQHGRMVTGGGIFVNGDAQPTPAGIEMGSLFDSDVTLRRKEVRKEGLSEYFLYSIEGTETIPDKWGKRLLSFDQDDIKVESLYKYDEGRYGTQTIRFVSFANDDDHNLGKTPIPNGNVKIYGRADSDGYLSYVGGASIKYIPVDEEVELNLGPARLVSIEPTLMDLRTANYVFDRDRNITGWDEIRTWKTEITNTRTLPVEIEITRGFGTAYWTLKADVPHEKHDVASTRFELTVQPRTKRTFNYTATTYHGVREEAITE